MKLLWLIRRGVKRLILWLHLGPLIEYCDVCGSRQQLIWHAPDHLWREINGGENGVLCPECFDRRAVEKRYWIQWTLTGGRLPKRR